jgi:hypothetical protein
MATRLCVILYSMVTLAMFLRVSRESQSRWSSIDVTLLVLWNLPVVYLAALRWTFSISLFCFLVCGDQMVEQYSRFYLSKDLCVKLLVCSLFIWRFLLKNPNNFCAFDVMLFMCAAMHSRSCWMRWWFQSMLLYLLILSMSF